MSMICSILGLSPAQVAALRETPVLASNLAIQIEGDLPREDLSPGIADLGPIEDPLDLAKSWHVLHYLLTGHIDASISPDDSLLTGDELGDDVGYGPPRLHDPDVTRDFNRFLERQDLTLLKARVSVREMDRMHVYAMPVDERSDADQDEDIRREVDWAFPALRNYVRRVADKGYGLLIWLS